MPFKDYYATLEASPTASAEEIRRSFHRLALKYHPDRNAGSLEAEERFKQINEAYQTLSDPQKRSRYDLLYKDHFPVSPPHAAAYSPHTSQPDDDQQVILQCPPNLRMFSSATQVVIGREWRFSVSFTDWDSILLGLISIILDWGFILLVYLLVLGRLLFFAIPRNLGDSAGAGWLVFAIFLLLPVLFLGYLLTAFFLNKTQIVVDASRLDLKHGPLPLVFPFSSPSQALRQVFYRKVGFRFYSVIVITDSWREKRLLDGLNHEEAAFIVQELKRFVRVGGI